MMIFQRGKRNPPYKPGLDRLFCSPSATTRGRSSRFGVAPANDPPYAVGTASIRVGAGKNVSYARFDSLGFARSIQTLRVDFDPAGITNRAIQVEFAFAAATPWTNGWPVYADHEHYP